MALDRVSLDWLGAHNVEIEGRVSADTGVSLKEARLAPLAAPPCTGGALFIDVYRDGRVNLDRMTNLAGDHRLRLVFNGKEAIDGPMQGPWALDLDFESDGAGCQRVPMSSAEGPRWGMDSASPGFLFGLGSRIFPVKTTSATGFEPLWMAFVREGVTFGPYRAWVEVAAGEDAGADFVIAIVSIGGDRVLWERGRWLVALGAGYDLGATAPTAGQDPPSRYGLHGPHLTPSLSFAPLALEPLAGLPAGHRNGYIELEIPVFGWFGVRAHDNSPSAPDFVVAPAVGLNFNYAL
jgi:hypothetical protein